jgi:DNA invertase Pin-like site-specific DNA recombinase
VKRFVALARVSSREQEREGFSLEVQEDALRRYATQAGGEIVKLFKIAETASKGDERKAFRELITYAKKNCAELVLQRRVRSIDSGCSLSSGCLFV